MKRPAEDDDFTLDGEQVPPTKRQCVSVKISVFRRSVHAQPWCLDVTSCNNDETLFEAARAIMERYGTLVLTGVLSGKEPKRTLSGLLKDIATCNFHHIWEEDGGSPSSPEKEQIQRKFLKKYIKRTLQVGSTIGEMSLQKKPSQEIRRKVRDISQNGRLGFHHTCDLWLPHQDPRQGLFRVLSGTKSAWRARKNEFHRRLSAYLYASGPDYKNIPRKEEVDRILESMFVSMDGVLLQAPPFPDSQSQGLAPHVDQTGTQHSIQAQFVFGNSDGSFAATPGSHLFHGQLMERLKTRHGKRPSGDWVMLRDDWDLVNTLCEENGIPLSQRHRRILAPAGSLVYWDSRVIHGAKNAFHILCPEDDMPVETPFWNFRCSLFVSWQIRPLTNANRKTRKRALEEGRATRHNGVHLLPAGRYPMKPDAKQWWKELRNNPSLLYQWTGFDPSTKASIRNLVF